MSNTLLDEQAVCTLLKSFDPDLVDQPLLAAMNQASTGCGLVDSRIDTQVLTKRSFSSAEGKQWVHAAVVQGSPVQLRVCSSCGADQRRTIGKLGRYFRKPIHDISESDNEETSFAMLCLARHVRQEHGRPLMTPAQPHRETFYNFITVHPHGKPTSCRIVGL